MGGNSQDAAPAPTYTASDNTTYEDPNKAADRDRQLQLASAFGYQKGWDYDTWKNELQQKFPDQHASFSDYNNQGLTAADYRSEQRIKQQQSQADVAQNQRTDNITAGRAAVDSGLNSFDDNYYNGISKSVLDYYMPQVDQQFGEANKQLTYDLARKGQLKSTDAVDRKDKLQGAYDIQRSNITNQAADAARQAKENVSSAKSNLYSFADSSADPAAVNNQLAQENSRLKAFAPELTPLGHVFSDYVTPAVSAVGNGLLSESNGYRGFNTGLFGNNTKSSVNTVRT